MKYEKENAKIIADTAKAKGYRVFIAANENYRHKQTVDYHIQPQTRC